MMLNVELPGSNKSYSDVVIRSAAAAVLSSGCWRLDWYAVINPERIRSMLDAQWVHTPSPFNRFPHQKQSSTRAVIFTP
jgi:hypothetical protein